MRGSGDPRDDFIAILRGELGACVHAEFTRLYPSIESGWTGTLESAAPIHHLELLVRTFVYDPESRRRLRATINACDHWLGGLARLHKTTTGRPLLINPAVRESLKRAMLLAQWPSVREVCFAATRAPALNASEALRRTLGEGTDAWQMRS